MKKGLAEKRFRKWFEKLCELKITKGSELDEVIDELVYQIAEDCANLGNETSIREKYGLRKKRE